MKVEIHSCGNKFFIIESNFIYLFNLNVNVNNLNLVRDVVYSKKKTL